MWCPLAFVGEFSSSESVRSYSRTLYWSCSSRAWVLVLCLKLSGIIKGGEEVVSLWPPPSSSCKFYIKRISWIVRMVSSKLSFILLISDSSFSDEDSSFLKIFFVFLRCLGSETLSTLAPDMASSYLGSGASNYWRVERITTGWIPEEEEWGLLY